MFPHHVLRVRNGIVVVHLLLLHGVVLHEMGRRRRVHQLLLLGRREHLVQHLVRGRGGGQVQPHVGVVPAHRVLLQRTKVYTLEKKDMIE